MVRACAAAAVPFVARGSGTGLSGGALPHAKGVLIVTSRMRRILEIDPANERAIVEPGVINLDVTRAAAPHGCYFAPDPSSQQICSVGGNVAENSGGAHCLKYGFTTHHVLGVEVVTAGRRAGAAGRHGAATPRLRPARRVRRQRGHARDRHQDRRAALRLPERCARLLAAFASMDEAGAAVSAIIAAGIIPAAIEMMDALAIEAAEAAVACGYPEGAGAVLIVEFDGPRAEVEQHVRRRASASAPSAGAFEIRVARDASRAGAVLEGPQVGVRRSGPDQPRLHRPGRSRSREPRCRRCCAIADLSAGQRHPGRQRLPRR